MPRLAETLFTPESLRELSGQLANQSDALRALAAIMEQQEIKAVAVGAFQPTKSVEVIGRLIGKVERELKQ